jgi:hypothetical protein
VPRGIKLLTSLCEGKLHLLKLPNPFPEVVGGDEQPAELALGTMSFRGELAWKHLADEASVKVRTLVECQEESSEHEQGPCPESSVACGGAFRRDGVCDARRTMAVAGAPHHRCSAHPGALTSFLTMVYY